MDFLSFSGRRSWWWWHIQCALHIKEVNLFSQVGDFFPPQKFTMLIFIISASIRWCLVLRNEKIYGLKYEIEIDEWLVVFVSITVCTNLGPCLVNAITFTGVICKWHTIPCTKCFYTYECLTKSHTPLHDRQSMHKEHFLSLAPVDAGQICALSLSLGEPWRKLFLCFSRLLRYFSSKLQK